MKPESIKAHCNQGTRLESAIARQGRLLAGEWTPPRCRIENLDVNPEDLKRNLDTATDDLRGAFLALCEAAFNGLLYVPKVVEESQQAAEALAKTVIAGFELSPATVHDLDALATQLENAYRGRARSAEERKRFAAAIRRLDGNTRAASKGPPASASANATERGAGPSMWQCVRRTAPARSCLSISPGRASPSSALCLLEHTFRESHSCRVDHFAAGPDPAVSREPWGSTSLEGPGGPPR